MNSKIQEFKPKLIVVLGPTAVGKSDVAVKIALRCNGEIISADSRQVYKGLDIGSGKITRKEMRGIPHHCLDIISPKKVFSVADFQRYATTAIDDIVSRGKVPILCGGTGFYIDAVVDGIVLPEVSPNAALRKKCAAYTTERLVTILTKLDLSRVKTIDVQNRVRLIRAIEIATALGKVPAIKRSSPYDVCLVGLDVVDDELKEKISTRIKMRIKKGMVHEAHALHEQGVSWKRMQSFGLEYGLLADLLQKRLTRSQFIERLTFDIWHFVKRQRAWFKRNKRIEWYKPTDIKKIIKKVHAFLR